MIKYRKKPIEIEAFKNKGNSATILDKIGISIKK